MWWGKRSLSQEKSGSLSKRRFDTYCYARFSAPSDSFGRLSFPPDSDLVAGGICGHVLLGSVLHFHIAFRQPTRGLRLYRSGLKLGCQRKQWQRRGSEGCCSGELSEGQHIRYPLCDGSTKFGNPCPLRQPPPSPALYSDHDHH